MGAASREAEGAGAEDDTPLHQQRREQLDDLTLTQRGEENREVDMLQTRVHWPCEGHWFHARTSSL